MSRVNTRPGLRAIALRISNSTNVVWTSSPRSCTVRLAGSIRRPGGSAPASAPPPARAPPAGGPAPRPGLAVAGRHAGAPQRGLHARAELPHRERLGDVVVGAELEPED